MAVRREREREWTDTGREGGGRSSCGQRSASGPWRLHYSRYINRTSQGGPATAPQPGECVGYGQGRSIANKRHPFSRPWRQWRPPTPLRAINSSLLQSVGLPLSSHNPVQLPSPDLPSSKARGRGLVAKQQRPPVTWLNLCGMTTVYRSL